MDTRECMYKRRSVREFVDKDVDEKDLQIILECAMSGPSARNKQPWEFYVIKSKEKILEMREASRFANYNSPIMIMVCGNLKLTLPEKASEFWVQDCSAVIENILLAATSLGLGSLWCGVYPIEENVKLAQKLLNLEEHIIPLGLIHIGYEKGESEPRTQFDESKVHYV